ncbi:GATA zinc finger domain-containing protein [Hirsutella rhossiliensis]|uniref:GATA zinc finger domain-containing protein n=1 Tax=Hirsutella rhossiliensis TaxID=111463 RepID=A0A9P8N646_9HYPO|nr:GATA zinc finger domain-containing protein [Hirsutella rhossiliensis]KAH0967635.1 GATA zinc finger domain-containing protein [Hirsutella rhossiliensis]
MATATVLAPSAHYPSYTPTFSQHSSASTVNSSAMISSEPRRHPEDNDSPNRQSLPSISEVISGTRPAQYPPHSQSNMAPGSGLPSSFPQAVHHYPISPRHTVPVYDPRAQPLHPDEADYANRARFDPSLNRHFEPWSYLESLSRIGSSSRVIFNFAEAYTRIAREQHGSQPIPERLPTEREVGDMLANLEVIKQSFDQVKDAVQASIQSERAREGIKIKGTYEEDHDVPMYGDAMKPQYAMPSHEVKKRRGRAAPPGRCHSCNRIDTPEWRRGPDGARTLCNACGLHYAKLERKRQLEARSIRPKPEDRS